MNIMKFLFPNLKGNILKNQNGKNEECLKSDNSCQYSYFSQTHKQM